MLVTNDMYPDREVKFVVDTGTPFEPSDCEDLINIVERSDVEVLANALYEGFKRGHEKGQRLYRPGFKFCFWFYDEESAKKFQMEFFKLGIGWQPPIFKA